MAPDWTSPKKENVNFARLCRLLVDGGTRVLRDVFDLIHSPSTLHATLRSAPVHSTLKGLRGKRVLNTQQWNKLYPASTRVTSGSFDITLLFVLLRNICGLTPPPTGWDKPPVATDLSREADLARVKYYRNELYGHTTETAVSDSEFEKYWKEISKVLMRLGGPQYDLQIKTLKIRPMDVEEEKYFTKILEDWEQAERSLKTTIENTGQSLETTVKNTGQSLETTVKNTGQSLETTVKNTGQSLETTVKDTGQSLETTVKNTGRQVMDELKEIKQKLGDGAVTNTYNVTVQDHGSAAVGPNASFAHVQRTSDPRAEDLSLKAQEYTQKLRVSIKQQTDCLLTSEEGDKKIRTDDIFTNVTIVRGKKQFKEPQEHRLYGRNIPRPSEVEASSTKLKTCSEMFVWPGNDDQKSTASVTTNPKSILVTGKAGIGKSLFCQKLVRDWAENTLLKDVQEDGKVPDFQFVVLLTFRQLSKPRKDQGDEKEELIDLRDMLNRSCSLDEKSRIDESLLQYIIENPEKLLIVIDGYDEYKLTDRKKITGDFETGYKNDAGEKMPVPALIAKIMKGKMLKESVVLISSRPGEAEELKKIAFDVRCDIEGFSSPQVLEYIEKYFKDNESMKKRVLDHIKTNEILLSFANIPVMCFLMCYCIKWYMTQSKTTEKLPVTKTELYYQVIILFLQKHSSSKYEEMEETKPQELMHKLAELAMSLTIQGKYVFDENYLKQFKLTEDEITNLKASGLLDCCAGVGKNPAEKPPLQFTFTHLTIQEFFTSWLLVEKKQIPEKEKTSDVTFMFMAGLCSMKNDEKLMEELIEKIKPKDEDDDRYKMCLLSCLYEYKDSVFSTKVIKHHQHTYCNMYGEIRFHVITDIDCLYISYLLDIVYLINEEQAKQYSLSRHSFIVNSLYIDYSSLSASGIRMLCNSLVRISTVTRLGLVYCKLDDECVKIICNVLSGTNITDLNLHRNNITDVGVQCLCSVLSGTNITHLYLHRNNITDVGVQCLCRVLESGVCRVQVLSLWGNHLSAGCEEDARKQIPRVKWYFK